MHDFEAEQFDTIEAPPKPDPSGSAAAEALRPERIGELLPGIVDELARRGRGESNPIPLPHWRRLAKTLGGGLWPGCHVLTGGTGSGKSQLALQLALQAARAGIPTRYVALELDAPGLVARLLCMMAGDGAGWWSSLYTGRDEHGELLPHRAAELGRVHGAELAALPLYLSTDQGAHGWSYDAIGPAVEQLRAAHPEAAGRPVLLVVDFLQLLASPDGVREDLRERIGKAAYQARNAARQHGAAVVLLSSTARSSYEEMSPKLTPIGVPDKTAASLVGMGKESGEIEYAADSALVVCRSPDDRGAVWLAVAKQRAGSSKWVRMVERDGWLSEESECAPPKPKTQTELSLETPPKSAKAGKSHKASKGRDRAAGGNAWKD